MVLCGIPVRKLLCLKRVVAVSHPPHLSDGFLDDVVEELGRWLYNLSGAIPQLPSFVVDGGVLWRREVIIWSSGE